MINISKKIAIGTTAALSIFIAGESAAYQAFFGKTSHKNGSKPTSSQPTQSPTTPASVPELDASGAPIALALIGGIAGIALEKRRRNKR